MLKLLEMVQEEYQNEVNIIRLRFNLCIASCSGLHPYLARKWYQDQDQIGIRLEAGDQSKELVPHSSKVKAKSKMTGMCSRR